MTKKINIIILLMVLCFLLSILMIKQPIKNFVYNNHSELDSAILYASYHKASMEKIAFPPSFLTSFLQKNDSVLLGYRCNPQDTAGFYKYYQTLPTMMKEMLDQKLVGIYFYENLSVDGYFHTVYSSKYQYYVIVCDQRILCGNLSEYLTDKENSRFIPSNYRINVNTDTVFNALFYVLLHEFFHIFDNENKISTLFVESGNNLDIKTSFITKYWQFPTVPQDSTFNRYYLIGDLYNKDDNKQIDSCLVIPIYTELSKGYFSSYYSTVSFQEDVAEYLALYYMTQHLNSKYEIEVRKGGELLLSFRPFENRHLVERFNDFPKNIQLLLNN